MGQPLQQQQHPGRRWPYSWHVGADGHVSIVVSVHDLFQPWRYLAHVSSGAVSHRDVMRAIELFGTEVAGLVAAELRGQQTTEPVAAIRTP